MATMIFKEANSYEIYDVNFYGEQIRTTVTSCAAVVDIWIMNVMNDLCLQQLRTKPPPFRFRRPFIVGLDIEWYHVDDNVATLQLCIGNSCLIFQILHADAIPISLSFFLGNLIFAFVGVGISGDIEKLFRFFGLRVACIMDLPTTAASKSDDPKLARLGLKAMCKKLLNKEMEKPLHVTLSRWDDLVLDRAQIEYACIDAFVSSQLGMMLQ